MNFADVHNTLMEMQRRLDTVPDAVYQCVDYNKEEVLSLRKDELLLGRDSDGQPFTPGYTEDPYFDTPQQADAYYRYKVRAEGVHRSRIEHPLNYPDKDSNTPNLRYTRDRFNPNSFHDQMFIRVDRRSLIIGSGFTETSLINAKYHNKVMNLGPGAKDYFYKWLLFPALYNHIWQ